MSTSQRNQYLDADLSEEDESSHYDSEAAAESRTAGLPTHKSKRRKLSATPSLSDEEQNENDVNAKNAIPATTTANSTPASQQTPKNLPSNPLPPTKSKPPKPPPASRKPSKPGVVYLSRIPPFMRPTTVRSLLSPHGPINQLFLTPEAPSTYLSRKHHGGNKKRSFIDGWVEFKHKRHAKACVDAINGNIVGGKKGGWYRDDVWNAKYLRGFAWDDLMAGVRQEEREREEKVRVGVARDKREREAFLRGLEGGKVEETRRRKRVRRGEGGEGEDADGGGGEEGLGRTREREVGEQRRFRQSDVKTRVQKSAEQPEEVKRVLSKIFGA